MIRLCSASDFQTIWSVINDSAQAYKGSIPADRCEDPYMSREKLAKEIAGGVVFWGYEDSSGLAGVMGIQQLQAVTLIRHAYVRTANQGQGIGAKLLAHLRTLSDKPFLIGTWANAFWAIRFYERHGFRLVDAAEKERLLRRFWNVPDRQIETSVVLVDDRCKGDVGQPPGEPTQHLRVLGKMLLVRMQ